MADLGVADLGATGREACVGFGLVEAETDGRVLARGVGARTVGDGLALGGAPLAPAAGAPLAWSGLAGAAITGGLSESTGPCARARGDAAALGK